jgi:hypothetical protein
MDYFSKCLNDTSLQKALKAYNDFLRITDPEQEESCPNPCQFSLVRQKTFYTTRFVFQPCINISQYPVTLRMPTTILLTESTFSYPFMTFASELGGKKQDWDFHFSFTATIDYSLNPLREGPRFNLTRVFKA